MAEPVSGATSSPALKTEPCEDPVYDEFIGIEAPQIKVEVEIEPHELPNAGPVTRVSTAVTGSVSDTTGPAIKAESDECHSYNIIHDIVVQRIKSEEEAQSLLYADHEVKQEMVIGPTEFCHPVTGDIVNFGASATAEPLPLQPPPPRSKDPGGCRVRKAKPKKYVCESTSGQYKQSSTAPPVLTPPASEPKLQCRLCHNTFTTILALTLHTCNNQERPFACQQCGTNYAKKYNYQQHLKTHCRQHKHSCNMCGKSYTLKNSLVRHQRVHNSETPFSCNQCDKRFSLKTNLVHHRLMHTAEKLFTCDHCGKLFTDKSQLVRHIYVHTGGKPFPCDQCSKRFTQRWNLVVHQRIHNGEKPFACNQCEKSFCLRNALNKHKRIHSGEKPFSCKHCKKRYTQSSHLIVHLRTHSGERPFKCDQCNKRFIQKGNLVTHQRLHSGIKPFACNQCDKRYVQKTSLDRHLTNHSNGLTPSTPG